MNISINPENLLSFYTQAFQIVLFVVFIVATYFIYWRGILFPWIKNKVKFGAEFETGFPVMATAVFIVLTAMFCISFSHFHAFREGSNPEFQRKPLVEQEVPAFQKSTEKSLEQKSAEALQKAKADNEAAKKHFNDIEGIKK